MERAAFAYLFIHANSLAELAFEQLAAALDADMASQGDPYADLSDDEREALALAQMGNMDGAAMQDGFAWETPEHEADVLSSLAQLEQLEQQGGDGAPPAESADLGLYLERAYAARDLLDERIDRCMAQVDHAELESLLADLPDGLAPLTQALDGQQMGLWLACHQDGHPSLATLVARLV